MNSSMTRKQRYIDRFIESSKEKDNIIPSLNDNNVNLNISSISRLEDSSPSKHETQSENDKSENDNQSRNEKKISRQPTFSSFTPQPRDDREYVIYQKCELSSNHDSKSSRKCDRNLSYQEGVSKPLISSLSGGNINEDGTIQYAFSSNKPQRYDSQLKSSDITHPQFFISSETKNFNMSSEGSRKYRSPTFEAISEEGDHVGN